MSRWGIIISGLYIVIVAALVLGLQKPELWGRTDETFVQDAKFWSLVVGWFGLLFLGPLALVFVKVDPYFGKERSPLWLCLIAVALPTLALMLAGTASLAIALDVWRRNGGPLPVWIGWPVLAVGLAWALWAVVFFKGRLALTDRKSTLYRWLIKGSVLELLIAVPSHVYVSRRGECTDPLVTGFGMATGAALMMASMGPGVFFLYRERVRRKLAERDRQALSTESRS